MLSSEEQDVLDHTVSEMSDWTGRKLKRERPARTDDSGRKHAAVNQDSAAAATDYGAPVQGWGDVINMRGPRTKDEQRRHQAWSSVKAPPEPYGPRTRERQRGQDAWDRFTSSDEDIDRMTGETINLPAVRRAPKIAGVRA